MWDKPTQVDLPTEEQDLEFKEKEQNFFIWHKLLICEDTTLHKYWTYFFHPDSMQNCKYVYNKMR